MTELYYRPFLHETPDVLPFEANTVETDELRTDLASHPESVAECGFKLAPDKPSETDTQTVAWDAAAQVWIMVDRPPAPEPGPDPSVPVITYKADVWRRATDDQAAVMDTELTKLDVRMRRLWDDATYLDHTTPEFGLLRATMLAAFGEEETDRILAPSGV